jgi:glycosyltransferase involved in cell wall biosynthesis
VRLLYLGRLVRAKGVVDLLEASQHLWDQGEDRFELTLAGNPRFSDDSVLRELDRCTERFAREGKVHVVSSLSDRDLVGLLASADALVIPSYHEGYCVPVIEAMSAGCYVIASDAGNLPNITGGLGTSFPAGDVPRLAAAIGDFATRLRPGDRPRPLPAGAAGGGEVRVLTRHGELDFATWTATVARHLEDYSEEAFERGFLGLLGQLAAASPAGLSRRLGDLLSERLGELERT